jgi:hypothetical protein
LAIAKYIEVKRYISRKEAIIDLQSRGYIYDFILRNDLIVCLQQDEVLSLERMQVKETHWFKGKSQKSDDHLLLAISSVDVDLKGILMVPLSSFENGSSMNFFSNSATEV